MEKTLLKSPGVKIFPPGKSLGPKVKLDKLTSVTFPDNQTNALLSPVVQATLVDKKKLLIKAVVFIAPEEQNGLDFDIYQNCYVDIEGKPKLQFFVCYDLKDVVGKIFDIYEVSFEAKQIPFEGGLSQIKTIETFLWDVDPIASRGTETNVQAG
ncbi:hypothetical protein SGQ83_11745 [Flavobacterium sp. Fl-318]|jgi:hypothetical protein|uniref:Uncharacterized protein n=1 Tax=Flavobacterium cupriresistens TaxID=2893885 RepID=A0ABU4RBT0_9FLAO|nr:MULTISPECIES: hypothetical protein [unclassified Flavobacterium]MDX6190024.1 hypothetical protein [Flavobacterium sp. Fl-318]UFH42848.1 hypothetical protein LNP23_01195 [Flavobacterium sp. F-323]